MNIRKLSLAILSIAAIAPVVASASPENVALNACAKAFATSIKPAGSSAPTFKLNYDQHMNNSVAGYYVRNYTFTMQAQDRKTGTALARGTCSADDRGEVLELTSSATAGASLAAR
jgi:Tfp pilus assembly protein PilW